MRVVLIEDEAPALAELERVARACEPRLEVLARLGSVEQALAYFAGASSFAGPPSCDLILCDLMLSDGLSLTIFEQVQVDAPVVFCTAYDSYWMAALARGGIDYVLKPIEIERLRQSFAKLRPLRRALDAELARQVRAQVQGLSAPARTSKSRIVVKRGLDFVSLALEQVAYFTAEHKLVTLVDREGREYLLDRPLAELAEELDPRRFFRANRRFLVAFAAIRSFRPLGRGRLALSVEQAAEPIVISQENARAFREWFER